MSRLRSAIRQLRKDYSAFELDESHLLKNPFRQFEVWMSHAMDAGVEEPNAMTLATIDRDGSPDARIVLLRGIDRSGFVFFTNYRSRKGRALSNRKKACLNFFWPALQRQIRINGTVEKVSARTSDAYFRSRPRESQIGAWASLQSEPMDDRRVLENRFIEFEKKFAGKPVPRPAFWGGYRLIPTHVEFWQGRTSRLHDRIAYEKSRSGKWSIQRLHP
ncbi:MAG: pyridoxamine 5-phosphate oxidase [Bacteroidota bacterium]|jgi:pyridoxamine 5'-phosphate oxidase